jgi:plastocyanin
MQGRVGSILVAATFALGMLLGSAESVAAPAVDPARHTVVISGVRFDPQTLTVKVGDIVIWVNHDPFPHTVTAVNKQFDSHEIAAERSWQYKARKAGVFDYACTLHPTMLGTLRVE